MLKLYPIITKTFDQTATSNDFIALWQSVKLPENAECYGVYFNYQDNGKRYDFAIATTTPNDNPPIVIDDLTWYEKFSTKCELLGETWDDICRKGQQGLLKRALTVDFEQYQKDGRVDVFVAVSPHC
ncbi:MAG: AraC family transcriptional regulator [Pasteurellaceae bacterium]|nr:AraC family transcriptional regulator [Pasteurellaceae bacterium]